MASVRRLLSAANYEGECEALRLILQLGNGVDVNFLSCEAPVLLHEENGDESRNRSQTLLEELLVYLVIRKFGGDVVGCKAILGVKAQSASRDEQPVELQSSVENLHESLLRSEWNSVGVSILARVVKRLQDPQLRQRFLVFVFQVLRQSVQIKFDSSTRKTVEAPEKFFEEVIRVLLLGVTDLWSAIRKECTKSAVTIVLAIASPSYVELFMDNLLSVSIGSRSVSGDKRQVTVWTEREGALQTLSGLLRSIEVDVAQSELSTNGASKVSQVKDDIKSFAQGPLRSSMKYRLGPNSCHASSQLPRCLIQTLKPAMYQCLRHDQLTVRQLAAQCLVDYAILCEQPTRLLLFQEVISKLNRINRIKKTEEINHVVVPNEPELLDAFEAEGLLDVLSRIAPCLPAVFLLKHWKVIFPTLEKYVMHIASSVRQQGSNVVLALAKLSLVTISHETIAEAASESTRTHSTSRESALKLIIQILISLSKKQETESAFCWQQKEGRLLSIDVLINVLGESLLLCGTDTAELLRTTMKSRGIQGWKLGSINDVNTYWAHGQPQLATWVVGGSEAQENQVNTKTKQGDTWKTTGSRSLIQIISAWVDNNAGKDELPASSPAFWQHVLSGCISQTNEAFVSSQFELRRISRQLLPGLMRLVIWTEQLEFVSSTQLQSTSAEACWCWTCVRYILLHLQYLKESVSMLDVRLNPANFVLKMFTAGLKSLWDGVLSMGTDVHTLTNAVDAETLVAKVEANMLIFLCFGAIAEASPQLNQFLDGALRVIHAQLPKDFQLDERMDRIDLWCSNDSALDRQFSLSLVPQLPAVVATFHYISSHYEVSPSTTDSASGDDRTSDNCLSWNSRWLCLVRTILAWLICDDMLRWITLNKSDAHAQLLESLRVLVCCTKIDQSIPAEHEECDRIVQCLNSTFITQAKTARMKTSTYVSLLEIHLQMWMRCSRNGAHCPESILLAIARLYSQRQLHLTLLDTSAKLAQIDSTCPATTSWDDWDEDDEGEFQQVSPVDEIQVLEGLVSADTLFQEALESLDRDQLHVLSDAVHAISLADLQRVPVEHVARMQQQIETCLQAQ